MDWQTGWLIETLVDKLADWVNTLPYSPTDQKTNQQTDWVTACHWVTDQIKKLIGIKYNDAYSKDMIKIA